MAEEADVILVASCGLRRFSVPVKAARLSTIVSTMLDGFQNEPGTSTRVRGEVVIPVNVQGSVLEHVIEWSKLHQNDPAPAVGAGAEVVPNKRTDGISEVDKAFLEGFGHGNLLDMILAANNMDIKGLLDVACKTTANCIKGKSAEEIRQLFNLRNDFTEEEENQIRMENKWCKEIKD